MTAGFVGMDELIADMQKLPDVLKGEAAKHIEAEANGMAAEVRQGYPIKEGKLLRGVSIVSRGPLLVQVKSKAPHAHLFEYGTVQRHNAANANRGSMPAKPTFVPAAIRHRRRLMDRFQEMLRGAKVRGMTGSAV